jgi:hypothetical protein
MSKQEQQFNSEIVDALRALTELDLKRSFSQEDHIEYKAKSRCLLAKLYSKLEDNFEYKTYLEGEIYRLEELELQNAAKLKTNKSLFLSKEIQVRICPKSLFSLITSLNIIFI